MDKIKNELVKNKVDFIEDFDVCEISSIRISQIIKFAIFPKTIKEFEFVLKLFYKSKKQYKVVGGASNILFVSMITFPVIFTSKMKEEYIISKNMVTVSAGMSLAKFIDILKRNRLGGIEKLVGIPATIGGAIFNNASAFGCEISSKLVSVRAFYEGEIVEILAKDIKFGYHFSNLKGIVVIAASFLFENKNEYDIISLCNEFTYKRTVLQPNGFSLGSVYQRINNNSAGFYIERAGLKQCRVGGIVVSKKHANFFVNDKNGTTKDFLELQRIVENSVEKQFGLSLVSEIEKVGEENEITSRSPHAFKL